MITVWGRRNSLNVQKVMWTLGELELDYVRLDAGGSFGFPDQFSRMNPNKTVPVIRDGDLVLWESNACVRYLAHSYGQSTIEPNDPATLARADQWMEWFTSSMSPAFFRVFINLIRLPTDQADHEQVISGIKRCARLALQLEDQLSQNQFIAGSHFTMGDIPFGVMMYRYFNMDIERPQLPNIIAWYERLQQRDPYQKHVMIPFGRNSEEWLAEEKKNAGIQ